MDMTVELCGLLEAKKELFLQYEKATLAMLDCEADDAEHYITQRERLATEIDALAERTARLCDGPDRALLTDVTRAQADFGRVPAAYHCVFYAAQAVRSVAGRIAESEKQVTARLETLREEARGHLRRNQNMPKIKRYLADLTVKPGDGSLTSGKA